MKLWQIIRMAILVALVGIVPASPAAAQATQAAPAVADRHPVLLISIDGLRPDAVLEADRHGLDETKAIALMLAQPTMIKRPVLDLGERRILAFKPDVYAAAFAKR